MDAEAEAFNTAQPTSLPSETGDFIRMAGYPHEQHTVVTKDGYVLQLERIARPGRRRGGVGGRWVVGGRVVNEGGRGVVGGEW